MSFETLGLESALLRALADQGYTEPTPIQMEAIPQALAGHDLLAGAQTGTGKTAAFALPLLQRLTSGQRPQPQARRVRALVLTPTRELAAQVHEGVRTYGKHLRIQSSTVFGGVGMEPQVRALARGLDVLVATPGRLIDHIDRRTVDLSKVEILVLDEADRMLDMGFLPSLKRILATLPRERQSLLFSATFADEIKSLATQFMRSPVEIQIAARNSIATTVSHVVHPVEASRKKDLLLHILAADSRMQTLVFARTKRGADRLSEHLERRGLASAAIHGDKSQGARTRALADFKNGRVTVLVATDIAARGIDIDQLPAVINFDLPMVAEDYVHRIGRTGRAGADGRAISLVSQDEVDLLRAIQRLVKTDLAIEPVAGFEPQYPLRLDARPPQRKPNPQRHARRPHVKTGSNGHNPANKKPRSNGGNRSGQRSRPIGA